MEETNEKAREKTAVLKRGRLVAVLIVVALFVIGTVQTLTGSKGFVTAEVDDQRLGVCGTYGSPVFLELETISDVQLADSFDFGVCIDGEETGNTVSGTYSCEEYGEYAAHTYTSGPYIIVHSPGGVLVFNCGSKSLTEKMYDKLIEAAGTGK